MAKATKSKKQAAGASNASFEAQLWAAADALRNNMDAAEYKHVVLGLIFLKYISDAFEAKHKELEAQKKQGADPEDPDEYRGSSIFWVPKEARWTHLKANAPQPNIGTLVDEAMAAIERDNPTLKGLLPKDFGRVGLDKQRLGQIINLVSDIALGDEASIAKDTLGRVYEYFLSRFASAEGKSGGQFYTPQHVVRLLVEMLAPYKGRVYDPCCGSGGMFVSSEKFIEAHAGKLGDISIYGQESNYTTWRLAKMNLAIRGIDAQIGHGDTFHNDAHPDLKADYVLANPPFNDSDWRGELLKDDKRWVHGAPPAGNANFAWVQHFLHHLAPSGVAGFVLANGSMSSNQSGEGEIRKNIIEADLVDCMVALPGQLFYSTQIPVCLWFLTRNKKNGRFRDRRGETLFIDARKMGTLTDRVHRELTEADVAKIAGTYHLWRGDTPSSLRGEATPVASTKRSRALYADTPGFCKAARLDDIRKHGHVLTPGRYVGAEAIEDDGGYRAKNDELGGTGVLFLRAGHVKDTHVDFDGVDRFRKEFEERVHSKMSKPSDAVVTTKGNSTGRTAFVSASMPPFVYSPHLSYWRSLDPDRIEGGFLRYWSKSSEFIEQLGGMKASTDMAPYLSLVDQKRLQISLPVIEDQRSLARTLGTLDDKIELNRRMSGTLESMARTLFNSWLDNKRPCRVPTAELIADGVLEIGDGYRAKNDELGSPGLPFIRAGDLQAGIQAQGAEVLRQASADKAGNKASRVGDVAFTSKGTIGRFARVSQHTPKCVYSPQVCYWRSLDTTVLHPAVLYAWMTSQDLASQIEAVSGQTDMALYVSLSDQRRMAMPRFPGSQSQIGEQLSALYSRQDNANAESRVLAAIRDALLPRLISGVVRVKDWEAE